MQKKIERRHRNILTYSILIVLCLTILQNVYLFLSVSETVEKQVITTTAKATGNIGLCINTPPSFNITCNESMRQDQPYFCEINGSDPNSGQTLAFSVIFNGLQIFNIGYSGIISFTPEYDDTGNHTANITLNDSSGCNNSLVWGLFNFSVENTNDPPYLSLNITDQQFEEGSSLTAFNLNDHFTDPDGDTLTFTVSNTGYIVVTLLEGGLVMLRATACNLNENMIFTATDPYNETADSNVVNVECIIPPADTSSAQTSGSSSSSGITDRCTSDWVCGKWDPCLPNGTRRKLCVDQNFCQEPLYFWKNCTYILHCYNGIQDFDEEDVDCGGVCPPCECIETWTCANWSVCYPNGTQTRTCVDSERCGTTFSKPAVIKKCDYYAHCYNDVQDENEDGVDCGGDCAPCKTVEVPEAFFIDQFWLNIIYIFGGLCAGLFAVFRIFHEQLKKAIVKVKFMLAKKVQKLVLVEKQYKNSLLKDLFSLEKALEKHKDDSTGLKQLEHKVVAAGRSYFRVALGLSNEASTRDLENAFRKKVPYAKLRAVLKSIFVELQRIETSSKDVDGFELLLVAEEIIELINLTANVHITDLRRGIKQLSVSKDVSALEKVRNMCFNTHIALQFNETSIAKKKYLEILSAYEHLSEKDRGKAFNYLLRLEKEIEFAESVYKELPK